MALQLLEPERIPYIIAGGPTDTPDYVDPDALFIFRPVSEHLDADLELARARIERAHLQGNGTGEQPYWLDLSAFPGVSPFGAIIRIWELLRPNHGLETYFFVANHLFEVGMLGVVHLESGWATQLAVDVPAQDRTSTGALAMAAGTTDTGDAPPVVSIARPRRRRAR